MHPTAVRWVVSAACVVFCLLPSRSLPDESEELIRPAPNRVELISDHLERTLAGEEVVYNFDLVARVLGRIGVRDLRITAIVPRGMDVHPAASFFGDVANGDDARVAITLRHAAHIEPKIPQWRLEYIDSAGLEHSEVVRALAP